MQRALLEELRGGTRSKIEANRGDRKRRTALGWPNRHCADLNVSNALTTLCAADAAQGNETGLHPSTIQVRV